MPLINRTRNGKLIFCTKCNLYHLEFGNLYFNFTEGELQGFKRYINDIDGEYFNVLNQHSSNNRKILLPTKLKGIHFALHLEELNEIKTLLQLDVPKKKYEFIRIENYNFSMN